MTWATSVPILVFLGLSVLDLGPMYATDKRQTDIRRGSSLNAPAMGAGHNNRKYIERHMIVTSEALGAGRISVQ